MLTLPALALDTGDLVFADDTDDQVFYVIPKVPRISRSADGRTSLNLSNIVR